MMTLQPSPISWPPSQNWDGDDGLWSSFALRVGTPDQVVRVLISTAGQATWVVIPTGCENSTVAACDQFRGGLFNYTASKSWNGTGDYSLGLEFNHGSGYNVSGLYGHDEVALGFSGTTSLDSQIIAGIATEDYYVGMFGLGQQPTNLSDYDNPQPSFLTTLRTKNMIPSLSWSYTAGAPYRLKGVLGSLTFGGYDLSRFVPNDVSFFLAPDVSRDLVVGLQSISLTSSAGSTFPLLPSPILTFIDSTLPWIYLPLEACQAFERELGLTLDKSVGLYLIDDNLHNYLTANGFKFTFRLGDSQYSQSGGPTVDIVLPYASFNLTANPPFVESTARYFPLLQAQNESQYTLGRTFLQEAYLITNYEHSNFSVSQCVHIEGLESDIRAISGVNPPIDKAPSAALRVSKSRIIGMALGIAGFLTLGLLLLAFIKRKRRLAHLEQTRGAAHAPPSLSEEIEPPDISQLREIDNNSLFFGYREMADNGIAELRVERSNSVSVQEITELPQSDRSTMCELMACGGGDVDGSSVSMGHHGNKSSAPTSGIGPAPAADSELRKPTGFADY